ncbi:MAG: hypothetical protein OXI43_01970 [Candidatus Poribacteria bacterium]|nr:hypothetical protein [Candidatus Poribacteria bacterium]
MKKAKDNSNLLNPNSSKMDKTAFSVTTLSEKSGDKEYWLSKTPQERLEALELMRQINYGYDPTTARLQRVLEIVELPSDYMRQTNGKKTT